MQTALHQASGKARACCRQHTRHHQTGLRPAALLAALACLLVTGCATPPQATEPRRVTMTEANCPKAVYPAAAKSAGAAGSTELQFEVDPLGKVVRIAITKPSGDGDGHRLLDASAMDTLRQCTFPAAPGFLPGLGSVSYVWKIED